MNLNLDTITDEEARALHRIVRAMHDGHCPNCGCLGSAESFVRYVDIDGKWPSTIRNGHRCPECQWYTTDDEEATALKAFQYFMQRSKDVFESKFGKREGESS